MKGKIALMVEDNEHVLALNRSVLEREGCTVLPAGNLAGARRALAEHPNPDIVVLDILLPDGNGLAFIPELGRRPRPGAYAHQQAGLCGHGKGPDRGRGRLHDEALPVEELLARMVALLHRRDAARRAPS
ncbi:MAG: response regulator [Eisenbergiella sp.]